MIRSKTHILELRSREELYYSMLTLESGVPVGVEAPDAGELQRKLNAIYAPYGVEFTVKVDDVIKELSGWKGRTFKLEGNGFFTRENADMAEIRKAYQTQKSTPSKINIVG